MPSTLLERDGELEEIGRLVDAATTGSGGVVVVEGPAGCGKTALLGQARALAEAAGAKALSARGGEFERAFPFGVTRQLFERTLSTALPSQRRDLLDGAATLAMRALGPDETSAGEQDPDALSSVLHGLYWLTVNFAERSPLVLVIDDLQWVDEMTLRWLGYLVRRLEGLGVLVVAAVRSGEAQIDGRLLDAIIRDERAQTLHPASLTPDAVTALVEERLGPPDECFAEACHRATAGNPFMLGELVAALVADGVAPDAAAAERIGGLGPESVARSVFLRLARLPAGADRLAGAVAVLGLDAELHHAAALAQLSERMAADAADALAAAGIVAAGRPLEFVHPIVRTAVYEELPAEGRALAHAEAARLLQAEGAYVQRVASHLRRAPPAGNRQAVVVLRRAARLALARGATADAVADLRRALEEPPDVRTRGRVLLELGSAERQAADEAAIGHLELAAETIDNPVLRCHGLRELSRAFLATGHMDAAVAASDRAVQALDGSSAHTIHEIEAELIAASQMGMLAGYSVDERVARLRSEPIAASTTGGRMAYAVLAFESMRTARPADEGVGFAELALRAGAALEPFAGSVPRYLAVLALLYADAFDDVEARCEDELLEARRRGSASAFSHVSAVATELALRRGRLADAEAHAAAILAIDDAESTPVRGFALSTQVRCLLERGASAEAAAVLTAAGIDALPAEMVAHTLLLARAATKIACGNTRAGIDDLEACGRVMTAAGFANGAPVPWRPTAALAYLAAGEPEKAKDLADAELVHARSFGAPRALGMALRCAGLVHGGAAGLELLRESVAVLGACQARLEHARALTDLGTALRRAGHPIDARDRLRQGLELADSCQATALSSRASEELIAAGARPRRQAQHGPQSLTPSERRVAQLAASGLGDREIAQTLFVTVKTVATHLGHVDAKLGLTTRAGLADKLDD